MIELYKDMLKSKGYYAYVRIFSCPYSKTQVDFSQLLDVENDEDKAYMLGRSIVEELCSKNLDWKNSENHIFAYVGFGDLNHGSQEDISLWPIWKKLTGSW